MNKPFKRTAPRSPDHAAPARPHIVPRVLAVIGVFLLSGMIIGYAAVFIVCHGPSRNARDLFVNTALDTTNFAFVANFFFSQKEIDQIRADNMIQPLDDVTDVTTGFTESDEADKDLVEVKDVHGATYQGKMMIVHDPSRVVLATLKEFSMDVYGVPVEDYVAVNDAVGGINASGFIDWNNMGSGGMPNGLVISDSKLMAGNPDERVTVVGFDQKHKLIVGDMTGKQAVSLGMRDAVSFFPALIINGKAAPISGTGGGLNPRTAIGQRADGAVLLLVIDGRQPQSLGATFKDITKVMQEFGAVNACNLDGGSSTEMVYLDEIINSVVSIHGPRNMPNSFIVLPEGTDGTVVRPEGRPIPRSQKKPSSSSEEDGYFDESDLEEDSSEEEFIGEEFGNAEDET